MVKYPRSLENLGNREVIGDAEIGEASREVNINTTLSYPAATFAATWLLRRCALG